MISYWIKVIMDKITCLIYFKTSKKICSKTRLKQNNFFFFFFLDQRERLLIILSLWELLKIKLLETAKKNNYFEKTNKTGFVLDVTTKS